MMIGKEDDPDRFTTVDMDDYQRLKDIEDRISDAVLCLDSTLDTLKTFLEMHGAYFAAQNTPDSEKYEHIRNASTVDTVRFVLQEKQREVAFARKKACRGLRTACSVR